MLESLKSVSHNLGEGVSRAWSNVAEGWRELWQRSSGALTRFRRERDGAYPADTARMPHWGLLAGEVYDNDREVVVRLEAPGLDKDNFEITADGGMLRIRGEKRYEHEENSGQYYLCERAYGRFERLLPLPEGVDPGRAEATYKRGVLTVRLPRSAAASARRITVH